MAPNRTCVCVRQNILKEKKIQEVNTHPIHSTINQVLSRVQHGRAGGSGCVVTDKSDAMPHPVIIRTTGVGPLNPPSAPLIHIAVSSNQEAVSNVIIV